MKLLFDQNLSYKLARAFSDQFPGSAHVRDLALASASDLEIWDHAKRFDFTIVSKDTDFSQRSFLFGPPPKVIWIRLGNCSTQQIEEVLRAHCAEIREFGLDQDSSFFPIDPVTGKGPTQFIHSGTISSIRHDPTTRILDVEFRGTGETYRYFEVTQDAYEALLNAESKEAYHNAEIKPKFRARKIL